MAKVKKKTAKAKTAAKPKAKMVAKPKAKTAAKPKAKMAAKPKAKMAAKPKAKTVAKPKAKTVAKPKLVAKLKSKAPAPAGPARTAVAPRPVRDEHAGITIAAVAPERIARAPRPEPAPLRMPYAVPVERPIAPLELRPRPLFAREVSPHDDEE